MVDKENQHLEQFRVAIEGWTDQRFLSRETLWDLAMFNLYLVNLADEDGWVYNGHSMRIKTPMSLLVVRATIDGVPQVVFVNGRTTSACVHTFLRMMTEGVLEWRADRYR